MELNKQHFREMGNSQIIEDDSFQNLDENLEDDKFRAKFINKLMDNADREENSGSYTKAYDYLWEALLIAEKYNDTKFLVRCHYELGLLYLVFNKEEDAVGHMQQALNLKKELHKLNIVPERELIRSYLGLAASYTRSRKFEKTNKYLDSCLVIAKRNNVKPYYILAEKANIAILQGKLEQAEGYLNQINPHFIDSGHNFEVIVLWFNGNLRFKKGELNEAVGYYTACLDAIKKYNAHNDIKPEALDKLAKIYSEKGMTKEAYSVLLESKKLNDSLFSAKNNGNLLDVKNKYREVVQQKNEAMAKQQKLLEQRKEQNFRLKIYLACIVLVIISGALLIRSWYQRKKFIDHQQKAEMKSKLEKEKQAEVIVVQNKEITSYTLQLIDKERIIDELLDELKKYLDENKFRRTLNATKDINKNLWNEFNERFTKVNSEFYKKLQKSYPSLSTTELKHCALIKLSFNGSEMAQLLNISVPSVHIARHRLRKKFGLKRGDNLAKFISEI
ncbi:hypothetical protein FUA24_06725 [Seonamhaeicola marinus]|uniref:Uncharacterized protein n=1 Tax=Seonamhaeicola marinus TaxID=1912246 RepID=A0A5D0IKM0_9FLAO|nr:hypothetical protein FUA24_06725 [Seonamhaeicola marinus]